MGHGIISMHCPGQSYVFGQLRIKRMDVHQRSVLKKKKLSVVHRMVLRERPLQFTCELLSKRSSVAGTLHFNVHL